MWNAGLRTVARLACICMFALFAVTFSNAQGLGPFTQQLRASADAAPAYHVAYIRPVEPIKKHSRVIDAKFVSMSALAMGLTIADIESTQHCIGNGTCREMNPLMPHSRAGMYAVNVPVNAGLMYLSYRLKASGNKSWWIAPLAISGSHAVGFGFMF
jgi:hypothetical protein